MTTDYHDSFAVDDDINIGDINTRLSDLDAGIADGVEYGVGTVG